MQDGLTDPSVYIELLIKNITNSSTYYKTYICSVPESIMQQDNTISEMSEEDESNSTIQSEAEDRLHFFVEWFVIEIEATLTCQYKILFGDLQKVGELEEVLCEVLGDVVKSLGLNALKSLLKKFLRIPFGILEKNKCYKYFEIIYYFHKQKSDARNLLVEIAIEVFKSFEIQFMGVTGDRIYQDDIKNLAMDAAQRFLNFTKESDENPPSTSNDFPANKLQPQNVVFGKSKKKFVNKFKPEIRKIQIRSIIFSFPMRKKLGFQIFYGNKIWNTASLFEKSGIVDREGNEIKLFARNQSKCAKYKFRRPFNEENWKLKYNDTVEDADFKYDYTLDADFYNRQEIILNDKIDMKDNDLVQRRSLQLIKELRTILSDGLESVKEEMRKHHEEAISVLENEMIKIVNRLNSIDRNVSDIKNELKKGFENLDKKISIKDALVKPKKEIRFGSLELVKFYTGRETQLKLIHEVLTESKESAISQIAVITGLGGIGKSQLAVKYAIENDNYYHSIIFINCEKKENIETSFKSLAKQLGISVIEEQEQPLQNYLKEKSFIEIVEKVYEYFKDVRLLMILDNVHTCSSIENLIFRSSSKNKTISTLITSRDRNFWEGETGVIKLIPLDVFTYEEAMVFGKKYLSNEEEEEDVKKLIETLSNLPLAMKQALAYIERKNKNNFLMGLQPVTAKSYLELYEKQSHVLLEQGQNLTMDVYKNTVATTWLITMNTIKENTSYGELALKIFHIMAYFSPENILVQEIFSDLGEENIMQKAVILLHNYSMIDLIGGVVSIHRIVQQVTRNHIKNIIKEEESILHQALELLNGSDFEEHAVSVWDHSSKYLKLIDDFFCTSEYGRWRYNPLNLLAAYRNDCKAIENLFKSLNEDVYLDTFNQQRLRLVFENPLSAAVRFGNVEIVDFIYKNTKQNFFEINDLSPLLHLAAFNGHVEVVKYFQKIIIPSYSNFESEVEKLHEWTYILDYVSLNGHENIIEILKPIDNEIYSFCSSLMNAFSKRNYDVCKTKIENASKKNPSLLLWHAFGSEKNTLLHIFCEKGNIEIVEILLKYINVDIPNYHKQTPIYFAAKAGNDDMMCFLMEKKANVNSTFSDGSLLHIAANACNVNTLKKLIEKGCNCYETNNYGNFPVHYTLKNNIDALKFFINEGMKFESNKNKIALLNDLITTPFINEYAIKTLVVLGANINTLNKDGFSALSLASLKNQYDCVKTLLEKGAKPNNFDSNNPKIAIHEAAKSNNLQIVKLLLKAGAANNELDENGNTALHMATGHGGKLPVVELLVRHGCDIQAVNTDGKTPLDLATLKNKQRIVEFFHKHMGNKSLE
ncbi:uncharacterized protein LOC143916511 isoform X2 [Arctopsyche grandis]|uniref:uncharacterized protein LOC143916511 isoform X2 n=1 Tax=Arctopsyche grandis TaxID=121162 RepID=UPI00406D6453